MQIEFKNKQEREDFREDMELMKAHGKWELRQWAERGCVVNIVCYFVECDAAAEDHYAGQGAEISPYGEVLY